MNCESCINKKDRTQDDKCLYCSAYSHYEKFPELYDFEKQKRLSEELHIIIKDLKRELYTRRQKTSLSHPKKFYRSKK